MKFQIWIASFHSILLVWRPKCLRSEPHCCDIFPFLLGDSTKRNSRCLSRQIFFLFFPFCIFLGSNLKFHLCSDLHFKAPAKYESRPRPKVKTFNLLHFSKHTEINFPSEQWIGKSEEDTIGLLNAILQGSIEIKRETIILCCCKSNRDELKLHDF